MVSRAFHLVAALIVAGFAFMAAPASAGGPCSYGYGCAVAPTYQAACGGCGAWVQPAPCNPCQPATTTVYVPRTVYTPQTAYTPQPVVEDDYVQQYRPVRRVRHVHRHPRPYYHREPYIRRGY